ncbi:hypothetical protein [Pseudomonas sp. NFACC05-1]|uniref:hypothetical protein n=1 Tax=Pseudomonas sp. NFACC05-1 TaxID=1566241 RepID=UPI0008714799|nr:hypothetical protein [Pseudomonas sp. NFACC05-1]SCW76316.1 hypothetical protein SAMN03159424_03013 [Pseudomonas sp. NFACC05-1]
MLTYRKCECCGAQFIAARSDHRFCKANCRLINHRAKKSTPEVEQAKASLFDFYKQQISQLSKQEILGAVAELFAETPEDRRNRKQSMLYKLLNKESQHV